MKLKHIKKSFVSQYTHEIRGGKPKGIDDKVYNQIPNSKEKSLSFSSSDTGESQVSVNSVISFHLSPVLSCDYFIKCQELNCHCKTDCQVKRFYDRYGMERYLNLGIGARI